MDDIRRLSVAERVELIGAIWDSIDGSQDLPGGSVARLHARSRREGAHDLPGAGSLARRPPFLFGGLC